MIEKVDKGYSYGIKPKTLNKHCPTHIQADIKLVTICGVTGTGKTLLALAGALEQKNQFDQIILARPILLSNRDLGFLQAMLKKR